MRVIVFVVEVVQDVEGIQSNKNVVTCYNHPTLSQSKYMSEFTYQAARCHKLL